MTAAEAAIALAEHQTTIAMGELVGIPCDIIIEKIQDILEQHPELWGSVDEPVAKKLTQLNMTA